MLGKYETITNNSTNNSTHVLGLRCCQVKRSCCWCKLGVHLAELGDRITTHGGPRTWCDVVSTDTQHLQIQLGCWRKSRHAEHKPYTGNSAEYIMAFMPPLPSARQLLMHGVGDRRITNKHVGAFSGCLSIPATSAGVTRNLAASKRSKGTTCTNGRCRRTEGKHYVQLPNPALILRLAALGSAKGVVDRSCSAGTCTEVSGRKCGIPPTKTLCMGMPQPHLLETAGCLQLTRGTMPDLSRATLYRVELACKTRDFRVCSLCFGRNIMPLSRHKELERGSSTHSFQRPVRTLYLSVNAHAGFQV